MGLAYVHLKYIENLISEIGTPQTILFLGRQRFDASDKRISKLVHQNYKSANKLIPETLEGNFTTQFMLDCGWAKRIDSLDISEFEGANVIHDLNLPINELLAGTYDLIIDGGTLEHVFNLPIALASMSSLLKIGGRILHISPSNNYVGHGFYQFSPELFASFYSKKNGFADTKVFLYDPKKKKILWRVKLENLSGRIEIRNSGLLEVWSESKKILSTSNYDVQQTDYVVRWKNSLGEVDALKEDHISRWGKFSPLLKKIKNNKVAYQMALYAYGLYKRKLSTVYRFYNRHLSTTSQNHKISKRNSDLSALSWK